MKFTSNFLEYGKCSKTYNLINYKNESFTANSSYPYFKSCIASRTYTSINKPSTLNAQTSSYIFELRVGSSNMNNISYSLDAPIEDLTITAGENIVNDDNMTLTITLFNNTNEKKTIKEIGIFTDGSFGGRVVMLAKEVLSEPVDINIGERYTFTVTLFLFIPNRQDCFTQNFKALFLHDGLDKNDDYWKGKIRNSSGEYLKNVADNIDTSRHFHFNNVSITISNRIIDIFYKQTGSLLPSTDNRNNTENELNLTTSVRGSSGSSSPLGVFMLCGSGTTKPKETDYQLEQLVPLTPMSIIQSHTGYTTFTETFVNNTTEAITVSELGLYTCANAKGLYFDEPEEGQEHDECSSRRILLCRQTIPSVTIEPNQVYSFSMQIF